MIRKPKKKNLNDAERRYAAAFESDAARAWLASLTPEQRAEAERAGLLCPHFESRRSGTYKTIEEGRKKTSALKFSFVSEEREAILNKIKSETALNIFKNIDENLIKEAVFSVLERRETLSAAARRIGESKQMLFYHVKNTFKKLKKRKETNR